MVRAWLPATPFFLNIPRQTSVGIGCSASISALILASSRGFLYHARSFLQASVDIPMKTFSANPETVKRDWYVVDASNKVLGRLATEVARRLRGKHKPEYTPHVDTGDYIVVINAGQVQVTGNKARTKLYQRYSGYQGGLKSISFRDLRASAPERVIETAVRGMLPKGPLGRAMFRKLKVYAGDKHEHQAQQPKVLEI